MAFWSHVVVVVIIVVVVIVVVVTVVDVVITDEGSPLSEQHNLDAGVCPCFVNRSK